MSSNVFSRSRRASVQHALMRSPGSENLKFSPRTGRNRSAVFATLPTCLSVLFRSSTPHAASLLAFFGAALIVLFHRPAVLECSPPLRPISDMCPRSEMTASLPFRLRPEYVYGPLPSSERHVRLHAGSRVPFVSIDPNPRFEVSFSAVILTS